jgi:hypothetical protein
MKKILSMSETRVHTPPQETQSSFTFVLGLCRHIATEQVLSSVISTFGVSDEVCDVLAVVLTHLGENAVESAQNHYTEHPDASLGEIIHSVFDGIESITEQSLRETVTHLIVDQLYSQHVPEIPIPSNLSYSLQKAAGVLVEVPVHWISEIVEDLSSHLVSYVTP